MGAGADRGPEDLRSRGQETVQRCKSERSSCAKVAYESIEYGVLSIGGCPVSGGRWQPRVAGGGINLNSKGDRKPDSLLRITSSGLRSRLIGYQVRAFWFGYGCGPEPVPGAEHPNRGPDS